MQKSKVRVITTLFSIIITFSIIQLLISLDVLDNYYQITLMTIGINIVAATGLNLIIGMSGQFSLGHAGFMAVGAYSSAIVQAQVADNWFGFVLGLFVGLCITAVLALLIAIPTLRLRGDYLAIATLGFAEIVRIAILNMSDLTNGAVGMNEITKFNSWPITFSAIVLSIVIIVHYIRSSPGRATVAIREDEIAAESMGINTPKYKAIAFIIGGLLASVAGTLHATYFGIIKPEQFGFMKTVDILIIVVFGGLGSITGTIIAAIFLGIVNIFLQSYPEIRMILYAVGLILVMIFRPEGLLGRKELTITGIQHFFMQKFKKEEAE